MKSAIFLPAAAALVVALAGCSSPTSSPTSEYEPAIKAKLQKQGACVVVAKADLPIDYLMPGESESNETLNRFKEKTRLAEAFVKVGFLSETNAKNVIGMPIRRYALTKEGAKHYFSEKGGNHSIGGFCYAPEELVSVDSVDKSGMTQEGGEIKVKYTAKVGPAQTWINDPNISEALKSKALPEGQTVSGQMLLKRGADGWVAE